MNFLILFVFKQYGLIDACKVSKTIKQENNKFVSNSNGYGFVKFNDKDVAMAVYKEAKLADPNIVIEPYLKERKKPQPNNLYVKNLSNDVDEAVLTEIFEKYGEIASVKVILDPATNKNKSIDKTITQILSNRILLTIIRLGVPLEVAPDPL